jgi:hypothetical protein
VHSAQDLKAHQSRHVIVQEGEVWSVFGDETERLGPVGGNADQDQIILGGDHLAQSLANARVVVGDDDAKRLTRSRARCRRSRRPSLVLKRALDILSCREAELNEDAPELGLVGSPVLLSERFFQLQRCDDAGFDEAESNRGLIAGLLAYDAQKADQVERSEGFDDERGRPDRAGESAVFWIVAGCEENHADGPRFARRGQLPAHGEAIAVMSLKVHVEEHDVGAVLFSQGKTLGGARRFENDPALSRERQCRDASQPCVVVRNEEGR